MTARIVHQRTGEVVEVFDTYAQAAEYRADVLRHGVPPDQPCPYAIRTEPGEVPN